MDVLHRRLLNRLGAGALALAGAIALSACGATAPKPSGTTAQGQAQQVSATPPASGCGSFAGKPPKDPDGVLASLSKEHQDALNLWPEIRKSAWAGWKPSHGPPYRVGIVTAGAVNDLQVRIFEELKAQLKASPLVGDIDFYSTGKSVDVPLQLQLFEQALQKKPDILIVEPLQPEAFVRAETRAAKQGIPSVNFLGDVHSPYSLDINNNSQLGASVIASYLARVRDGKGRVLFVHGFPGTSADTGELNGVKAVLANCPGLKLDGEVIGAFANSAAKSETLKFLATHPTPPDLVVQAGGMGPGVLGAYTASGRPVPALGDIGAVQGSLNYWNDNKDTFQAMGFGQPAKWTAAAVVSVALRTLQGQGPKINSFAPPVPLITNDNLDEWVDPAAGDRSEVAADGPRDAFLSEEYLNGLFTNGKAPDAGQ